MSLQAALNEIEPSWYATGNGDEIAGELIARARGSRLGRRVLAHWLATGPAPALGTRSGPSFPASPAPDGELPPLDEPALVALALAPPLPASVPAQVVSGFVPEQPNPQLSSSA